MAARGRGPRGGGPAMETSACENGHVTSPAPRMGQGGLFAHLARKFSTGRPGATARPPGRAMQSLRAAPGTRQGRWGHGPASGRALTCRNGGGYNQTCRFRRQRSFVALQALSQAISKRVGGVRAADEKDTSTQAPPPPPGARVSAAHVDAGRQASAQAPAGQRAGSLDRALSCRRWAPGLGRLTLRRDFQRVFRYGRRGTSHLVTVWALRREGTGVRVGFAVGRRVGRAVVRNRVRRRLREALRRELGGVVPGLDVVIGARPGCEEASFDGLREALRTALRKAGAWAGPA